MQYQSLVQIFDDLAAGKPVMINYDGWQAELLNKTKAGFTIPKNNPKQAAKLLNDVLKNKERMNQMSLCSERLSLKFDINTNYQKFEQVIDTAYSS